MELDNKSRKGRMYSREQNKWLEIEKTALKGFLILSEIDLEIDNWQLCKKKNPILSCKLHTHLLFCDL